MDRRSAWIIAIVIAALLGGAWGNRYEVVPLSGVSYVVVDRITGTIRICQAECSVVEDYRPRPGPYEDLVPKK